MIKYKILEEYKEPGMPTYQHCGKIEKVVCDKCGKECEEDRRVKDKTTESGYGFKVGKFHFFGGNTTCGPMFILDLCEGCSMELIKDFETKNERMRRDYF